MSYVLDNWSFDPFAIVVAARRRSPRGRSGEPAPALDPGAHQDAAAALPLLLRRAGVAPPRRDVAHRLLGGRLLLRPHDRAHPHRLLRPDPHRGRCPVAPACCTAFPSASGAASCVPCCLVARPRRPARRRPLRHEPVDRTRLLQRGDGALARPGAVRRGRGEPTHPHLADARQLLRDGRALLAADHPVTSVPVEGHPRCGRSGPSSRPMSSCSSWP